MCSSEGQEEPEEREPVLMSLPWRWPGINGTHHTHTCTHMHTHSRDINHLNTTFPFPEHFTAILSSDPHNPGAGQSKFSHSNIFLPNEETGVPIKVADCKLQTQESNPHL